MGRSITQTASTVVLTAKQRALQNGTPKWVPEGSPRACYAMISYNTSTTGSGVALYDRYFQPVVGTPQPSNATLVASSGAQHHINTEPGINISTPGWLIGNNGNATTTQSQLSTNSSGQNYLSSMITAGELGNAHVDIYSNGTIAPVMNRDSGWNNKFYSNICFVNSDHKDQSICYVFTGGYIRAISRIDGSYNWDYPGTSPHYLSMSGSFTNMWGSASYNAVRKELVVFSYYTSNGAWYVRIYKGVDFDKYPSPAQALTAGDVTVVDKTISSTPSWPANDNEVYYSPKVVLVDSGTIYLTIFYQSAGLYIFQYTRDGSDNLTGSYLTSQSCTTSYSADSGFYYRQKAMQSRDGGAVLTFCQYYYYGCGLRAWLIDKRKSTYVTPSALVDSQSGQGTVPLPYGDSGFASFRNSNVYAGSPTGAYVTGIMDRNGAGNFQQTSSNIYLPHFTMPNTTNYTGFTQVTDYSLLDNQAIV